MSEPRVPLLGPDAARAAATEAGIPEQMADLSVFRVWLHQPKLARWLNDLILGLIFDGSLDGRLRELVIMRLGWATASEYEWTQHWSIALRAGLTEDEITGVRDWEHHDGFGPAERAVLAATDETLATGTVSDATWHACTEHVSDDPAVLVELVAVVGTWRMVSGHLRSLGVPLDDGVTGWPPDGATP